MNNTTQIRPPHGTCGAGESPRVTLLHALHPARVIEHLHHDCQCSFRMGDFENHKMPSRIELVWDHSHKIDMPSVVRWPYMGTRKIMHLNCWLYRFSFVDASALSIPHKRLFVSLRRCELGKFSCTNSSASRAGGSKWRFGVVWIFRIAYKSLASK